MKKNKLINIFKILPAIIALVTGVFLFTANKSAFAEGEGFPSYFSIYTADYDSGNQDQPYTKSSTDVFSNGDAIFLNDGQAVVLEFDQSQLLMPDGKTLKVRQDISPLITINGVVSSTDLKNIGIIRDENKVFKLALNPALANGNFAYGSYSITLSYAELDNNYDSQNISFTVNFYVLKYSDYCGASQNKYFENFADVRTNQTYFYNYTKYNGGQILPTLTVNTNMFNVYITKVYQQLTFTTQIKNVGGVVTVSNFNEMLQATSQNYVNVNAIKDETSGADTGVAVVAFNDIGTYYISYETLVNGTVFGNYFDLTSDKYPNNDSIVYMFGYQAFYTGANGLEEFKQTKQDDYSKIEKQADITSLLPSSLNDADAYVAIKTLLGRENNPLEVVKTNQAPVYFRTNATVNTSDSVYYYFQNMQEFTDGVLPNQSIDANPSKYVKTDYACTPLSTAGVYLVKLAYTFDKYNVATNYQYFLFEITNSSPEISIYEDNANKSSVPNDYITNNDIVVKKLENGTFDSPSILKIYKSTNFDNAELSNEQFATQIESQIVLTESAKYKVELTYGNNNQKKYVTYFTIDKTGITDVVINSLVNYSGSLYSKAGQITSFATNSAVAIEWNNKEVFGKAQTYAEYRFFPTSYSSDFANSLTSSVLENFYRSPYTTYGIPSVDTFKYSSGDLPASTYSNTRSVTSLSQSHILSQGGLYIIKIYDQTALTNPIEGVNVIYKVLFIDKTKTNILTSENNVWSIVQDSKTTSSDYSLYFGAQKLIQFEKMPSISDTWDAWLKEKVIENDAYKGYFKQYKTNYYLVIDNQDTLFYSKAENGGVTPYSYSLSANEYKITEKAIKEDGTPNEAEYVFYLASSSNTNITNSFDSYYKYFDARHQVTFSTDNSRMILSYRTENGTWNLQQFDVIKSDDGLTKYNYYQPTATNTLTQNDEMLNFSYCIMPSATLVVDSIKMEYYAFEKSDKGTYVFKNEPTSSLNIYQNGSTPLGTAVAGEANTYIWGLNPENYNVVSSADKKTRTRAGKYVITRTYENTNDVNDPKKRVLTFIVDRNGIISAPEVDSNGDSIYYTGGGIKLQVLNNYSSVKDSTLFFQDIYFANQMSQGSTTARPVLTTNLLPVTLYVPAYKYGYDKFDTDHYNFIYGQLSGDNSSNFNADENSVVDYLNQSTKQYNSYSAYKLSARVEYREGDSLATTPQEVTVFDKVLNNNYLTTSGSNGIVTFNKNGFYHVIIESNGGDVFTFDFCITYQEPEYSLLDDKNNPINGENGVYYTNKPNIRIYWPDSPSAYMAKINQDEISYVVSNGVTGKIDPKKIMGNSTDGYYVDLNLAQINGAYADGSTIDITLQYKGEKSDYSNQNYFSKTTRLVVDLQAPTSNITSLIAQTGLSFNTLREYATGYGNKYNMSKSSGLYANYSYVVDIENFLSLLKTPVQTEYDFYKAYYRVFDKDGLNTKYVIGNTQESEIYLENYNDTTNNVLFKSEETFETLLSRRNLIGKYVEFVEEDYAGNRTVYTIYITDASMLTDPLVTYSSSSNKQGNILYSDLTENKTSVYSKYSLSLLELDLLQNESLSGRYFQVIEVNGVRYVKTPFSGDKFYKEAEFTTLDDSKLYSLTEIATLTSSSSAQSIVVYNMPKYQTLTINAFVLNEVLQYYTLAKYEDELLEGIMIKLPSNSADTNIIYATSLTVTGVVNGEKINPFKVDDEKYFISEQPSYSSQNYKITYVKGVDGSTYIRLEVTRRINKNDYFIYTFYDNFGEEYKVPHIYGQIEIKDPITSNSEIINSYDEDGNYVYYASQNIVYKYDTTIYSSSDIVVNTGLESKLFRIARKNNGFEVKMYDADKQADNEDDKYVTDTTEYKKYFECSVISNAIMVLEMKQATIDVAKGVYGGRQTFKVTLTLNEDFGEDNDVKVFSIYNKVPKISLMGTNGENITYILGNKSVYTNDISIFFEQTTLDFPYELYLITPSNLVVLLTNDYVAKENGTYRIVVNYLGDLKGLSTNLNFTIKNTSDYKYSVMKVNSDGSYTEVFETGVPYSYTKTGGDLSVTTTIQTHYIVNGDYAILLNDSLGLIYTPEDVEVIDDYTTVYKIHTDYSNPTITSHYTYQIAISKIPQTNILFKENNFVEYDSVGNSQDLTKSTSIISSVLTKDGYNAGKKISWSNWYLIKTNKIKATIYYGEVGKTVFTPIITETENTSTITLKTSGVYYFKFTDLAGNSHFFGTYLDTEYFAVKYLSSVIFEINDESPIDYAIYDKEVKVSVPETTLSYYDQNARPSINVELNGKTLEVSRNNKFEWTFDKAGLYKVWFSAKINGENIYEAPLFFTILSSNESRMVFSYATYGNSYIQDILFNGKSVNDKLANANTGTLYNNKYLKDITLHVNDVKTGAGVWTFVINANNEFNQQYSFTIWINKANVPITISHESGTTTTDNVTITFLASNLLSEAGDCIVKITGQDDIYITSQTIANGEVVELNEIVLSQAREYFIEVTSLSGQLLFSSYINKTEPLNTVSIIIIVVSVVVFVVALVTFILLRKKMKIK